MSDDYVIRRRGGGWALTIRGTTTRYADLAGAVGAALDWASGLVDEGGFAVVPPQAELSAHGREWLASTWFVDADGRVYKPTAAPPVDDNEEDW